MLEEARRSRRKKDKKPIIVKFCMFLILMALIGTAVARPLLEKWLPSSEEKDLAEWFEVSGDQVRIYLDNNFESAYLAFTKDDEIYLPNDYVAQSLNGRFYYNEAEEMISYTLADRTDDYKASDTAGEAGAKAFIYDDGVLYLSLSLVENYTNISHTAFTGEDVEAKRLFIHSAGTSYDRASAVKTARVRTSADKKAPILTSVPKDGLVTLTNSSSGWSRVVTDDGIVGYIDNDYLEPAGEEINYPDTYQEPAVSHCTLGEKVVLGWHTMYSASANSNLTDYYNRSSGVVNVVSPQWLQINDADGGLLDLSSSDYVEKAHGFGLKVWASVDNVNQEGGINDFNSAEFFGNTSKRRDFIVTLIDKALKYGYDGLNLDFEALLSDAGPAFVQFIRELSVECHKLGLTLSVDNPVPYSYNAFYNLSEQGVFADYVIIMAYDEHYEGGDPGPVASIGYTEYAVTSALARGVPEDRLVVGVPFYTRIWKTVGEEVSSENLGMAESETYVTRNGISLSWDDAEGMYYGSRTSGSTLTEVWLEDDASIALKADKVREYGIAGIAAWRLGIESRDVWAAMDLNNDEN